MTNWLQKLTETALNKTLAAVCYGDSLHNPMGKPLLGRRLALSWISKTYKQLVA